MNQSVFYSYHQNNNDDIKSNNEGNNLYPSKSILDCYKLYPYSVWQMGPQGPTGPTGPAGTVLNYADFYALMPPDNAVTVAAGKDVNFPQDGLNSGPGITRIDDSSFQLEGIGVYQILFEVGTDEAGQLVLTLNGTELTYTVVGGTTGTTQIVGISIIETSVINSILTVRNPAGNSTTLTITPSTGGTRPVSAHLVITQLR